MPSRLCFHFAGFRLAGCGLVSSENALEAMGISVEEAREVDKKLTRKSKTKRDRRVCVCGHAVSKHTTYNGILVCKPSAMMCPCKKITPVLEAEDTRMFLRKTEGAGPMHALTRGISACLEAGRQVEWIVSLQCARCGSSDKRVTPVPVTQNGYSADYATGFDALLCDDCRVAV
jgi:hypothetical protein